MLRTMEMTVLTLVVIAANVLGGAMAVPQAWKLLTTGRLQGVSLTWAALSATVNAWWGGYGIAIADRAIVPVSVISVTVYLVIAVVIVRSSPAAGLRSAASGLGVASAVSLVPAAAIVLGGWLVAGVALGALYGVQLAPAVIAVYRTADVSGVAAATWVMALAEAALWGVHGISGGDVGIVTLAATGVVMSALVLARLVLRRPRRDAEPARAGAIALAPA